MDRRTFLAVSTVGLGVGSGCSEFFGSEPETTGQDPDSTPTGTPGDGRSTGTPAPTVDSIDLRTTDTAGAVRYSVRASDAEAITALEVASPSDAATRPFDDRTSIRATGTVGDAAGGSF